MTDLIEQLRKAKTAHSVAELLPKIEQERMAKQRTLDDLENSREDAILEGKGARARLNQSIVVAKEEVDEFDAASRVAARLLKKFQEEETKADLERGAADAARKMKEIARIRRDFIDHILGAKAAFDAFQQLNDELKAFRTVVAKAGRSELKPTDPDASILAHPSVLNHGHPITYAGFKGPFDATESFARLVAKMEAKG